MTEKDTSTIVRLKDPAALRELIRSYGYTVEGFATHIGVSNQRMWKMLSGDLDRTTVTTATAIADAVQQPVADLFEVPDATQLRELHLV